MTNLEQIDKKLKCGEKEKLATFFLSCEFR